MNLPKLNPRHFAVAEARAALTTFLTEWEAKHKLTTAEYLDLLGHALTECTGFLVRAERDKGQDEG